MRPPPRLGGSAAAGALPRKLVRPGDVRRRRGGRVARRSAADVLDASTLLQDSAAALVAALQVGLPSPDSLQDAMQSLQHSFGSHAAFGSISAVGTAGLLHGSGLDASIADGSHALQDVFAVLGTIGPDTELGDCLSAMAALAFERLPSIQSTDPDLYVAMQQSMAELFDAVCSSSSQVVAGMDASQLAAALLLTAEQLVKEEHQGGVFGMTAVAEVQRLLAEASVNAKAAAQQVPWLVQFSAGLMAALLAILPRTELLADRGGGAAAEEAVPLRYDPEELGRFWSKRPLTVARRTTEVVAKLTGFLASLLADWHTSNWEANMPARAAQIRCIVEGLGATCVKIAQAASTRVDMLPQAYIDEFSRLQDNVQRFSTEEARDVLEDGLGRPVDAVFEWLSEEPLAAASLGQVYRGKLRGSYGGAQVAVKVQRPNVLASAALDVFILRGAAVLLSRVPGMSEQWACALDDWALRFFQEMDYQLEADHTAAFKHQMARLRGIVVPTVHASLTSRKVIVTDWIDAVKLSAAPLAEVRALISTMLNCYLIQLLETGLLHADPHPGNLMVTADGRLVILDFGLVTEVTEAQRVGLVEFIAHLTMEDWDALTQDLVTLEFMPPDMSAEARARIQPVMTHVFSKIASGGGLGNAGLNFTSLGVELSSISMNFQMCIPGYFTNVIRAFSVIEGTALRVDPSYAIVAECMPYLSRRLLTDNNPRMRAALRQLLYGDSARLDVARLQRLIASFSAFTTSAATDSSPRPSGEAAVAGSGAAAGQAGSAAGAVSAALALSGGAMRAQAGGVLAAAGDHVGGDDSPVISDAMREALKVVFSKDGSYAQELLVEELVAATDAMSREALSEALRLVMGSAAAMAALRNIEALGPLRAVIAPIPGPVETWLRNMAPPVVLSMEDRQALTTLRSVLAMLAPTAGELVATAASLPAAAAAGRHAVRAAAEVAPLLPELLPGVQATAELFAKQLVRRMAQRLADDLAPELPKSVQPPVRQLPHAPPQQRTYRGAWLQRYEDTKDGRRRL